MKKGQTKQLTAGIFILLLLGGGVVYLVNEGDTPYYCEATDLVGICWKLSNVNSAGTQTRCYYNQSAQTRYKTCKTGWNEFTQENITGHPIPSIEIIDINFSTNKRDVLNSKGIFAPSIGECIKKDNFTCSSRIYEVGGIDKEIFVDYHFCSNETINETLICNQWETLSESEIEDELKIKTQELLNGIVNVENQRNSIEEGIPLTNKTEVNLE